MRSEDEQLSCLQLASLAPVGVVQEGDASRLQLQRQYLHAIPAVDWCGDFAVRDGAPHQRHTAASAV